MVFLKVSVGIVDYRDEFGVYDVEYSSFRVCWKCSKIMSIVLDLATSARE